MACRKPRSKGSSRPRESRPRDPGLRREHPGDPVPAESRPKGPRPWDPAWVGQVMRKRGMTAIHKNYKFGKECNTTAVLFFYNKIHDFWDGSVYNPDGGPLPDANVIVRTKPHGTFFDRWLMMAAITDTRYTEQTGRPRWRARPAHGERKEADGQAKALQSAKADNGAQPADAQRASHASPALTQITVAGSESVLGDRGASIWSVPGTPASPTVGPLDNCDGNEHDEPEDDGVDEEIVPTSLAISAADHDQDVFRRQQEPRTSPPAIEHDAEGEPYEAADGGAAFTHDGAGEPIHFEEPREQPTPHEFSAMMLDDPWAMDMGMAGFQGTADFDMDYVSDMNFDINMAMNMLSNAGELQEPPGSHSPKAPTASLSATGAVASAASPHEAAGGNQQTSNATATDEPAPQPAPGPDWSATVNPNNETTRASQPAPIASAQPPNPPVTTTQTPYRCTPEEVLIAMQQALVGLIAERGWNVGAYQDFGGIREPHAPVNMSIPVLA
ncbi:hypothetical protein CDV36_015968 [Fusarium kuroshium]|uniref:Uncharacterized protein n=1 Tax=Fusarium kuroshium TaxID=2010991 RepID=A0A3M2R3C1_9HYPO|nr:hypothetical protein CDV36_015968 [Fusarium kuroshium]